MSAPDWSFWIFKDSLKRWQVAALSLGMNPYDIHRHPEYWEQLGARPAFQLKHFRRESDYRRFLERCELVEQFHRSIPDLRKRNDYSMRGETSLAGFVKWAADNNLSLPPALTVQRTDEVKGDQASASSCVAGDTIAESSPPCDTPRVADGISGSDSHSASASSIDAHGATPPKAAESGPSALPDADEEYAALFDPVGTEQLQRMFPTDADWKAYAERAARNGLHKARIGLSMFNPYRASIWWLERQNPVGWDRARCDRVLANNLPARSKDSRSLLTGELD